MKRDYERSLLPLTIEKVRMTIASIQEAKECSSSGHILRDQLWLEVLQAIAEGRGGDPATLAAEAIKTEEIDFPIWYE